MEIYWEICWSMYSHRLIYPLWSVQGCEFFPIPFPSHKVLECLPPGILLPGWSVCIVKFQDYFNDLGQCCFDVELKFSLSRCRTLCVNAYLLCYLSPSGIWDWRTPTLKATQFVAVQKYVHFNTKYDNFIHGCTNLQVFKLGLQSYDHWEFDIHCTKCRVKCDF